MTTAGRDRRGTDDARERRETNDVGQIPLDQPVPPLLALQQSAGNAAAVSRLVARSRLLLRDDAPGTPAPSGGAAPAVAGANPVLEMAKIAWDTGVTQREPEHSEEAPAAPGGAAGANRRGRATDRGDGRRRFDRYPSGCARPRAEDAVRRSLQRNPRIKEHGRGCAGHNSPAEIGQHISTDIESSQLAISDITKPLPIAPGSASGGSPSASNAGSASTGGAATAAETAAAGTN